MNQFERGEHNSKRRASLRALGTNLASDTFATDENTPKSLFETVWDNTSKQSCKSVWKYHCKQFVIDFKPPSANSLRPFSSLWRTEVPNTINVNLTLH